MEEQSPGKQRRSLRLGAGLALVPLAMVIIVFFFVPLCGMLVMSFMDASVRGGGVSLTLDNYAAIGSPTRSQAFRNSIVLSAIAASVATVIGLVIAAAICFLKIPAINRFVGVIGSVLANSGGAPLAFSFIVLVGNVGYLRSFTIAIDPKFTLYSVKGLVLMYQYFLIPTMVLLMLPSFHALRLSWREANTSLGGTGWTFWRYVGLPILWPTVLGAWFLLLGSSFATHACAAVLMGTGAFPLATLQIGGELASSASGSGQNVAMAMGIVTTLVAVITLTLFNKLHARSQRWLG